MACGKQWSKYSEGRGYIFKCQQTDFVKALLNQNNLYNLQRGKIVLSLFSFEKTYDSTFVETLFLQNQSSFTLKNNQV